MEKRYQRLTAEHESENRRRREGESRIMELEQQIGMLKVEQTKVSRRCEEELQEAKKRVRICVAIT